MDVFNYVLKSEKASIDSSEEKVGTVNATVAGIILFQDRRQCWLLNGKGGGHQHSAVDFHFKKKKVWWNVSIELMGFFLLL